MKSSHSAVRAFAQFVLYIFDTASLDSIKESAIEACAPHRLKEAVTFFVNRGFASELITTQFLEECSTACGWHKQMLRPRNTFKDMLECLKQHQQGLVTDGELLLAVQMVPHQVQAVITYNNLPMKLLNTVKLDAWDADIAAAAVAHAKVLLECITRGKNS